MSPALLLAAALNQTDTPAQQPSKPNVLFIAVDDLNDWVGYLKGHPQTKTPNIDKLASQGVAFTKAYCPAPSCCPSRASILTGIAPQNSGCYSNGQVWRQVLPDAVTLPRYFMDSGYYVAGAGKIFHHYQNDPPSWHDYFPSKINGFPEYDRPTEENQAQFPAWENMYVSFNWGPTEATDEETGDYKSVEYVSNQLAKDHDKPFFLNCGIYRPHLPWFAPRKYFDMFPLDEIELPPMYEQDIDDLPPFAQTMLLTRRYYAKVKEYDLQAQTVQAYLASTALMDEMVGRLLKALDESQYANNTIVVFWSDHGWQLGEKNHYRKFAMWEDIAHVPFIIRAPGVDPALCESPVNLLDIYPTLVELANLKQRDDLDGHSLVPLLKNVKQDWPYPSVTTFRENSASVRTDRWRLIRYPDGSEELYDHNTDPNEWTNLAQNPSHESTIAKLRELLPKTYKKQVKTEPPADFIARRRAGGGQESDQGQAP